MGCEPVCCKVCCVCADIVYVFFGLVCCDIGVYGALMYLGMCVTGVCVQCVC